MSDRWTGYGGGKVGVSAGWRFEPVVGPSRLWGANGIVVDGDQLMVTQVFGSQVTAIDVNSGVHRAYAPLGGGIAAPDDGVFGHDGTFFATEPMNATISARNPDGTYRKLRDDLPGINGITMDHSRRRLFADEFRPGGRLWELDPSGEREPTVLLDDLFTPNALAMGPDGALWFPQVVAGEIWRYDLDTKQAELRFSGLASPCAVKFDSSGHLMTSESGSGAITRIDITTGERRQVAALARGIDNLALGSGDRLFVSHFTDGRVVEVLGDGSERVLSESGLVGPYGIAPLGEGLVAADGLSVAVVDAAGGIERTHTLLSDLPTFAIDVTVVGGDPWVLGQRGQVFRCRRGERAASVAGHLNTPGGIAAAADGTVYVAETGTGRVVRLEADGSSTPVISGLDRPDRLTVAADGTLWVTTPGALLGCRNGAVESRIESLAGAGGVAAGADGWLLVTLPARRQVRAVHPGRGEDQLVARDAPLAAPVAGAELPHSAAPVAATATGWLVGCIGDGTVRAVSRG